jgi:DNA helicase-2/ATP-dependent DNA helicase PcrA
MDSSEMVSISKADLDWYDSNTIADFQNNYNTEIINFKIGDVIVHTIFGSGVIIGINGDMLDIAFKSPFGIKSLIKNHKSIKRLKH